MKYLLVNSALAALLAFGGVGVAHAQSGQQQGSQSNSAGADIHVKEPAPHVKVQEQQPNVQVQQPKPDVVVKQPQPQVKVQQRSRRWRCSSRNRR